MSDARKVYLVSSGAYSDYSIRAVFSTREMAQAYIDHARGPDGKGWTSVNEEIEEFALDAPKESWDGAWIVIIDHDGSVMQTAWTDSEPTREAHARSWGAAPGFAGYGKTPEHARRSAEELRRRTLVHSPAR